MNYLLLMILLGRKVIMLNLKVGQTVYRLNINNAARNRKQELTEVKVTNIGRKYFTVKAEGHYLETKHYLEDGIENAGQYSPTSRIYIDPKDWEKDKCVRELNRKFSKAFSFSRSQFSYDQLIQVNEILFPDDK